jgi:hypothetical protein
MNKMWSSSLSLSLKKNVKRNALAYKLTEIEGIPKILSTTPSPHKEQALSRSSALHYIRLLSRNTDTDTLDHTHTQLLHFRASQPSNLWRRCDQGTYRPKKDAPQNKMPGKSRRICSLFCSAQCLTGSEQHWPRESAPRCRKARSMKQCRLQPSVLCTSSASLLW